MFSSTTFPPNGFVYEPGTPFARSLSVSTVDSLSASATIPLRSGSVHVDSIGVVDSTVDGQDDPVVNDVVSGVADHGRSIDPSGVVVRDLLDHSPNLGSRAKDGVNRRHGDREVRRVPRGTLSTGTDECVDLLGPTVLGDEQVPEDVVRASPGDRTLLHLGVIVVDVPVTKGVRRSSLDTPNEAGKVVVKISAVTPVGSKTLLSGALESANEPSRVGGALLVSPGVL